jgi:hypothetical protein
MKHTKYNKGITLASARAPLLVYKNISTTTIIIYCISIVIKYIFITYSFGNMNADIFSLHLCYNLKRL